MIIGIEQLEAALSSLNVLVAFLDSELRFVRVNAAYAATAGKTPDFFVGKRHFDHYPDPENEALFHRVLASGEPSTMRAKPFEHPDQPQRGTTYWDFSLQRVVADSSPAVLALILIDVTEHVRAKQQAEESQRELTDSEARYRLLFNSGNDVILAHPADSASGVPGCFTEVNDLACVRLGYTREELLRMSPADLDVPGWPRDREAIFARVARDGHGIFESRHRAKDGREIPVEINVHFLQHGGQTQVVAIARDITERKQTEEALRQSEENLRALFNATRETVFMTDTDGTLLAINEVAAGRLGLTQQQSLGRKVYDLIPKDLAESRRKMVAAVLRKREMVTFEDRRNGRRLVNTLYPVIDADGEVHRIAVYSDDVTELRELEEIGDLTSTVNQKVLEGAALAEVLHLMCERMVEIFDLPLAWIGRKEVDGAVYITASAGAASGYLGSLGSLGVRWDDSPLGRGPGGMAIRTGHVQIRKRGDARFKPWAEQAAEFDLNAIMGVPLIVAGQVYGALVLYSRQEDRFDGATMKNRIAHLAGKICLTLGIAAEHAQVRLLGTALASASNSIMITDRDGTIHWVNAAFSELCGYAESELLGRKPNLLKSGRQDMDYYRRLWETVLAGKPWSGETTDRRKDGSLYTVLQRITPIVDDDGEVTHFITIHEDITEQLETQARIHHLAHHDALTGLPNRLLFFDRLHQACGLAARNKLDVTLLYMDLDGFKAVNDRLGHDVGDLLLQEVAKRLQACIRSSDTLARMGGDEFVIILHDAGEREGAELIAEKILREIARPFQLGAHEAAIGISIGMALGGHTCDEGEMMRQADEAMYTAKHAGKNNFRWHEKSATRIAGA